MIRVNICSLLKCVRTSIMYKYSMFGISARNAQNVKSQQMHTICCSGHISCHACLPHHASHLPHMPLPCTPPAMHYPHYHICPPAMHASLPHMHPAMHVPHHTCPPATYAPCHTCPPAMHAPPVDRMTDRCKNITLLQLHCGQ